MSKLPFSHPVDVGRLGAQTRTEKLAADREERIAVAADLGILAVDRLEADVELSRWRGSGVKVEGVLRAAVDQACVVTLQPVRQVIEEPFSRLYLPPEAMARDPKSRAEAEVIVAFDEDDPPEPLEAPSIDVGEVLVEQLALALDPYPRAPGAELEIGESAGEASSAFAALSKLRDK